MINTTPLKVDGRTADDIDCCIYTGKLLSENPKLRRTMNFTKNESHFLMGLYNMSEQGHTKREIAEVYYDTVFVE